MKTNTVEYLMFVLSHEFSNGKKARMLEAAIADAKVSIFDHMVDAMAASGELVPEHCFGACVECGADADSKVLVSQTTVSEVIYGHTATCSYAKLVSDDFPERTEAEGCPRCYDVEK